MLLSDSSTMATNASRESRLVWISSLADNVTGCPHPGNV
jgi:hypothetical protein